jgi:membrane protein required for colicin V production
MQPYDGLMLTVLIAATLWGAYKGLAWQIASIGSLVASYLVALRLRASLAVYIPAEPPWNIFLAMLILFVGTGAIVWLMFNVISEFIEQLKLQAFDRQLGALFGAAKGALLCALITLFGVTLLGESQRQAICNSRSGYYIALLLDRAQPLIPRELHQVLAPYLDEFEHSVPHPHAPGSAGWNGTAAAGQAPGVWTAPAASVPPAGPARDTPRPQRSLLPSAWRRWFGREAAPPPNPSPPPRPNGSATSPQTWPAAGGPAAAEAAPRPTTPLPAGSFPVEEPPLASPPGAATPWRPPPPAILPAPSPAPPGWYQAAPSAAPGSETRR